MLVSSAKRVCLLHSRTRLSQRTSKRCNSSQGGPKTSHGEHPEAKKKIRFATDEEKPPEPPTVTNSIKTWLKADNLFAKGRNSYLAGRPVGTLESGLLHLSSHGIQTSTLRVYRMKVYLIEEVIKMALAEVQKSRAELQGTVEFVQDGTPTRYVDTFPIGSPRTPKEEQARVDERPKPEKKGLPEPDLLPQEDAIPITLEVIENASSQSYLSEVNSLLNIGFVQGAPLMRVRIVRHGGGTDMLITGHQAIFDENSFEAVCHQLLDYYDICAEGRMKSTNKMLPILASVDSTYPESFQNTLKSPKQLWKALKRSLNMLALDQNWRSIPRTTALSPSLNKSSVIFGSLDRIQTIKLIQKCAAKQVNLDEVVYAAFMASLAKLTRDATPTNTSNIALRDSSLYDRFMFWIGSTKDENEEQLKSERRVPIVGSFITSLRDSFDPPMASRISGPLSSFSITPMLIETDISLWEQAKKCHDFKFESNLSKSSFTDVLLFPILAELCADDEKWEHPSLPAIVLSELSYTAMTEAKRARFKLYDEKSAMSCWNPGVCITAHVNSNSSLQLSISYRKPLIADQVAHDILKRSLERLSL